MTHLHLEVGTFCCELGQLVEQVAQLCLGLSEGGEDLPGAVDQAKISSEKFTYA